MKNRFLTLTSALLLFSAVIVLNSCSKDDEVPANVIEDAQGLSVDLEWTTGGSATQATDDYDLDLKLYNEDNDLIDESTSGSEFETMGEFFTVLDDGEYTVAIRVYSVDEDVTADADYTITVDGVSVNKPQVFEGSISPEDENDYINLVTITKAGNKYTVTDAN